MIPITRRLLVLTLALLVMWHLMYYRQTVTPSSNTTQSEGAHNNTVMTLQVDY